MNDQFNKPERGGKPGVYELENAEGDKVRVIAERHTHADAFIRLGGQYVMSIEDWRAEELKKRASELKETEPSDKKGK